MTESDNQLRQHSNRHPDVLDSELKQLPSPPAGLLRPWNWTRWKRIFGFSFFIVLFGFWFLGRLLDIPIINLFSGSCGITISLYMVLGLYLMNRFQMRGYSENYSRRANKLLHQAMKRYKRPQHNENFLQIFPRYIVNGEDFYLSWYVPRAGTVLAASLKPSSEPLIFNSQGQWVDDELLFSKISLMWSIVLSIAPRTFQQKNYKDVKFLRRFINNTLTSLPENLKSNEKVINEQGLKQESDLIIKGLPAYLALYRNSLDTNLKIIQWADKYGWDSITEISYDDCLLLQNGTKELEYVRDGFKERHNHASIRKAATRLVIHMTEKEQQKVPWKNRKELELGLRGMTEEFPNDDSQFRFEDGIWIPPEEMKKAYRSRVTFARQIDEKEDKNRE